MPSSPFTRRQFLAASAALPALANGAFAQAARPNIVFILADDLGYGNLGCFGQKRIKTPHLDRMASEGMRFTQAYSGATVCAPSRCTLMTGKHTGHATVRGNSLPELGLKKTEPTVAEILLRSGYRTALFGKWGLGGFDADSHPNDRGFQQFFGYLNQHFAHNSFPEHIWDNKIEMFLKENWFNQRKVFTNDLFSRKAIEFVGNQSSAQPFFLYLPYTTPHANNERGQVDKNGMDAPDFGDYADEGWPDAEKAFAAIVSRMDADIGRLFAKLKEKGLDENTLVIFSSDNGP
ncbi:MAG: sulfatase-like hydrolase/transferase [Bryobacterales bacterium]|nr:sulfatase-like hydrolase/transferase [Bryobacterales bacterium]